MPAVEIVNIAKRLNALKIKSAEKYNISPEKCHVGHIVMQAMEDNPEAINQTDAGTDQSETHGSVLSRACRLASAMKNFGLKVGDRVAILGPNHLDLAVPYYACHFNGYTLCGIDANVTVDDLQHVCSTALPKMLFCLKSQVNTVKEALAANNLSTHVVVFDGEDENLELFVQNHNGTEVAFRPAEFDQSTTTAWLMMTSGTTGRPKLAIVPYDVLLNAISCWWSQFTERIHVTLNFGTIQWMSALLFYISGPLMNFKRIQTTVPPTPQWLAATINKYRPNATAWTPYLLGQFLDVISILNCDLSSFKYIAIGGSAIEKSLVEKMKQNCDAYLYLVYGMTELLVPVFEFNRRTPFGSSGKALPKFQYKIVTDEGNLAKTNEVGELWIKGDEFFKGYLNNPEETKAILTDDGWVKTGDIFYKDEDDFYYFVERKRLLIKYEGLWIPPLQLEEVIKTHPEIADVCVVGLPHPVHMEVPAAAVVRRNGTSVDPKQIFELLQRELPPLKQLHGGLFFVNALPTTPSGKVHRAKAKELAMATPRVLPGK